MAVTHRSAGGSDSSARNKLWTTEHRERFRRLFDTKARNYERESRRSRWLFLSLRLKFIKTVRSLHTAFAFIHGKISSHCSSINFARSPPANTGRLIRGPGFAAANRMIQLKHVVKPDDQICTFDNDRCFVFRQACSGGNGRRSASLFQRRRSTNGDRHRSGCSVNRLNQSVFLRAPSRLLFQNPAPVPSLPILEHLAMKPSSRHWPPSSAGQSDDGNFLRIQVKSTCLHDLAHRDRVLVQTLKREAGENIDDSGSSQRLVQDHRSRFIQQHFIFSTRYSSVSSIRSILNTAIPSVYGNGIN